MAIIVVGGGGRGAGKTALVCGLIRALPEISWIAVKISGHAHGKPVPIWEETAAGQETDTARYLAAGARRALLVTAEDAFLGSVVQQILEEHKAQAGLIFESNRVLDYLQPDLCLCCATSPWGGQKPSYGMLEERMDASVALAGHDHVIPGEKLHFHLVSLGHISPPMLEWLREQLGETDA